MKTQLSPPIVIVALVIIVLLIIGVGWYAINRDTGVIYADRGAASGKQAQKGTAAAPAALGKSALFRPGSQR